MIIKRVLNIGSNSGFLTCYISEHVKDIDAIELNPYLVEMGYEIVKFLKISNINFIHSYYTTYNF